MAAQVPLAPQPRVGVPWAIALEEAGMSQGRVGRCVDIGACGRAHEGHNMHHVLSRGQKKAPSPEARGLIHQ